MFNIRLKMPVTGLPATLERTLTALLTDNAVSSWKIAGERDNTVVVLRLKAENPVSTPSMADPILNQQTQIQYRKQSPGQLRRDRERATKQQQQRQQRRREQTDSISHNELYVPHNET
ncbi:hypothetical protein ACOMHN_008768 [Nucella lapillus]